MPVWTNPQVLLNSIPAGAAMKQVDGRADVRRWTIKAIAGLAICACVAAPVFASCSDEPAAGVDWSGCSKVNRLMAGYDFSNANLENADFSRSDLTGTNFSNAKASKIDLSRSLLNGAIMTGAMLDHAIFDRAVLTNADLSDANLDRASFDRAELTGAKLSGGKLQKAELGRALLGGADLTKADLTGAFLARADLRGARLDGANFRNATVQLADLRDTDLSTAINLTAAQIEETCGNAGTKLPPGIAAPVQWQCSGRE